MKDGATLQHILHQFLDTTTLDTQRRRVCRHLQSCRTAALGGMRLHCNHCESEQQWYHSCRNRHCPQCQIRATRQWSERQQGNVLPVRYYHLVFTLPHELNGWIALHPEVIYRLLFKASWATLHAFGQNTKSLGGELGMSAVLHTWGQNLSRHVHLHCLVPGGVLCTNGQYKATRGNYLFPVRALSRHFRGRLVTLLRQAIHNGELGRVTRPGEPARMLNILMGKDWVVYTKACLHHTVRVIDYLSRHTHRIAITNSRLLAVDERHVTFRIKDYRDKGRAKSMSLRGEEFVRRFLHHVLPKGLMRIRHYGYLANRCRREKLVRIRRALAALPVPTLKPPIDTSIPDYPCPKCKTGKLPIFMHILPRRINWASSG